mmetsp:Transcript_8037/g.10854  ORF Transcript_8037/g.10854 Transcript_8037/m.10854 type:complete len:272 (-) Transcript_8037:389-1204(-)
MHRTHSGGSLSGRLKVYKPKPLGLAGLVAHDDNISDGSVLLKFSLEGFLRHILGEIFHKHVCELGLVVVGRTLSLLHERANVHLLAIHKDPIHGVHSLDRSLFSLKVHETVSLALAQLSRNLAGENSSKGGESVMQRLVINSLFQVLNEDVAHSALPGRGVTVAPHDADGLAIDLRVVQSLQRTVSCMLVETTVVVDIGVSKGTTGHGIATHTNRRNWSDLRKEIVKLSFGDLTFQVTNVKRCGNSTCSGGSWNYCWSRWAWWRRRRRWAR